MAPLEPQPRYLVRCLPGGRSWFVRDTARGDYLAGNYSEAEAWDLADALNASPEEARVELIRRAWTRQPLAPAQQLEEVAPPADT